MLGKEPLLKCLLSRERQELKRGIFPKPGMLFAPLNDHIAAHDKDECKKDETSVVREIELKGIRQGEGIT